MAGRFRPRSQINDSFMNNSAKILGLVAVIALSFSCSVREDRGPCPGYLEIDLDAYVGLTGGVQLLGWRDEAALFDRRVDISRREGNSAMLSVPKGEVNYCAWFGLKNKKDDLHGRVYGIPLGKDADPLYAFTRKGLLLEGEYLWDKAEPHRHHCILTIHVDGLASERLPELLVRISSGTSGINLEDLSPIRGNFQVSGHPGRDGILQFTLLRQGFGDLQAEIYDGGRLVGTYDLSSLLDVSGYDWTSEDLADIRMNFSVSSSEVSLVIGYWDEGGTTDVSY